MRVRVASRIFPHRPLLRVETSGKAIRAATSVLPFPFSSHWFNKERGQFRVALPEGECPKFRMTTLGGPRCPRPGHLSLYERTALANGHLLYAARLRPRSRKEPPTLNLRQSRLWTSRRDLRSGLHRPLVPARRIDARPRHPLGPTALSKKAALAFDITLLLAALTYFTAERPARAQIRKGLET